MVLKQIKSGIRHHDLFGHLININFNRKGSTHKTLIGGLVSIIVQGITMIYITSKLYKLLWRTNDELTTTFHKLPDLETIYYDDLGVLLFWVLRKTKGKEE